MASYEAASTLPEKEALSLLHAAKGKALSSCSRMLSCEPRFALTSDTANEDHRAFEHAHEALLDRQALLRDLPLSLLVEYLA